MIDTASGHHEARIDGATNNPAQRVPGSVIKPVVEWIEPVVRQVFGRPVVEVRVKLMDNRFKPKLGLTLMKTI